MDEPVKERDSMRLNRAAILFLLAVLPLTSLRAEDAPADQAGGAAPRLALVIGNAEYSEGPLRNTVKDALDITGLLKELGFEVQTITNADQRTMEEAIRGYGEDLRKRKIGLFYYAGHGVQFEGTNYLIPINSKIRTALDVKYNGVNANYIIDTMMAAQVETSLVILDACRDNPYLNRVRSLQRGLARVDSHRGLLIAYATSANAVAYDGNGENGTFTKHLLAHLGAISTEIEVVFRKVRAGVYEDTDGAQIPWVSSSLISLFTRICGYIPVRVVFQVYGTKRLPPF